MPDVVRLNSVSRRDRRRLKFSTGFKEKESYSLEVPLSVFYRHGVPNLIIPGFEIVSGILRYLRPSMIYGLDSNSTILK